MHGFFSFVEPRHRMYLNDQAIAEEWKWNEVEPRHRMYLNWIDMDT